ncbi:nuclear transport factor 2 family protein [Fulvivirgaceae bacterium BMA10]|uniref:Nuclear transport factor 2 family protein n=1 Tax=Splendidivirga corallicola TaxID=3051826 RepID=A0ABT8KTU2_9BACT|nr:nuclear transport factor 2 family protein [Fulvivirgaceae bacterium BMA10]
MHKQCFSLITLLLVLLISCQPSNKGLSQEEKLETLKRTITEFNEAFKNCNVGKLESLITHDYLHTNGNNNAIEKSDWLNYLKKRKRQIDNGELVVQEYKLLEPNIAMYQNSAILSGKILTKGISQGETFTREIRITNLWVEENGHWKRAGFHDTRIH